MNYQDGIIRDPQICGRQPGFKAARVLLRNVPAGLAAGETTESIIAGYPSLKLEDVQATIAFAAASAEQDLPVLAVPRF
jgi:uncharacterized protein (DUF433 family)